MTQFMATLLTLAVSFTAHAQSSTQPLVESQPETQTSTPMQTRNRGFDYRFSAGTRSLPLGAAANAQAGYGIPIWGEWQDKSTPWYGYIHPTLDWSTAVTINEIGLALRAHPVSFVELVFGRSHVYRIEDTSFIVDCRTAVCDGELTGNYGQVNTTLGVGKVFLLSELELRDFNPSSDENDFYEDGSALRGKRGFDRRFSNTLTVGLLRVGNPWVENLLVGLTGKRVELHGSGQSSDRLSLVAQHDLRRFRIAYIAGVFQSDLVPRGAAIGVALTWNARPGLEL